MSNYVKSTNFTSKDSLPAGSALKIVKGAEFDVEFNAIATAVASKADLNSPEFSGVPIAPTAPAGTNNSQIATTAYVQASLGTLGAQNASSVNITGGTLTNVTVNGTVSGSNSRGNRTISSEAPTGGADGDMWFVV